METAIFWALWLIFNAIIAYIVFYVVSEASETTQAFPFEEQSSGSESDSSRDGPTHAFAAQGDSRHPDDGDDRGAIPEDQIRCPNCGQVQESGFTFCEVCISPLYRSSR